MFLTACHKNEGEDIIIRPGRPGERMERTLIIYMAAENNLSHFVDGDSLEIAAGLNTIPIGARVVVFIDDARSSRVCVGTNDMPLQTVMTYNRDVNAADSADMLVVLKNIFQTYPADHYGISFWSHGSGWVVRQSSRIKRRSFGIDNGRRDSYSNTGTEMNITTMGNVLRQLPHTDYVLFDACFMQCVEVAYELRDVTDFVIGSPAEIPGDGAAYQLILPPLCKADADIDGALRAYYENYDSGPGHETYHGVVLSAVRTSALEALAAATRPLVAMLFDGRSEVDASEVQRYSPRDDSDYYTEYYDISHLFYKTLPEAMYAEWRVAMENAVPYRFASNEWYTALIWGGGFMPMKDAANSACMSMFVPGRIFDDKRDWNNAYHQMAWYRAAGFDQTGW